MITIYGKPQCPYCDMAQALCNQKGVEYEYKSFGTDFTREEMIEKFPTARTFPQIILEDEKIGGFEQLKEKLG